MTSMLVFWQWKSAAVMHMQVHGSKKSEWPGFGLCGTYMTVSINTCHILVSHHNHISHSCAHPLMCHIYDCVTLLCHNHVSHSCVTSFNVSHPWLFHISVSQPCHNHILYHILECVTSLCHNHVSHSCVTFLVSHPFFYINIFFNCTQLVRPRGTLVIL